MAAVLRTLFGLIIFILCLMAVVSIINMSSQLKRIADALEAQNTSLGVYQNQPSYMQPIDDPNQHKMPGESWADFKARTGRI